jgi:radical SAM protein with 4Fe4S-binding SPASM domain
MINISKLYRGLSGQSDDLRYHNTDSFGPVVVYNCTQKCNLRCLHCYSSSEATGSDDELNTNQAKDALRQLTDLNCPVVLFSGGEPLLRPDIFELLSQAKSLGLRTVLSTNGTLIDTEVATKLCEAGVDYVGISIDGDEEFHDEFRQVKGCFSAALAGIENCQKAGIRTGLRFTITKANAQQIPSVFDIAASENARRICFYHLIRTGRASSISQQLLSQQETRYALEIIIERTAEFVEKGFVDEVLTVDNHADGPYLLTKMKNENNPRYREAKKLLLANGGNKIGEKIACIGWNGSVYPDQFWRNYSLGNIKDRTFSQIWRDLNNPVLKKLRNKKHFADARCLQCRWFNLCKGNYRFLGNNADDKYWLNEPACYLTGEEITE